MKKVIVFVSILAALSVIVSQIDFSFFTKGTPAFHETSSVTENAKLKEMSLPDDEKEPTSPLEDKNDENDEITAFHYEILNDCAKQYYSIILSTVNTMQSKCIIDIKNAQTLKDDINMAVNGVFNDHPEIFWVKPEYEYTVNDDTATIILDYYFDKATRDIKITNMRKVTDKISLDTPQELYSYICDNISLVCDEDAFKSTSYSAIVEGAANTDGLAAAYQLLCNLSGISCVRTSDIYTERIFEDNILDADIKTQQNPIN